MKPFADGRLFAASPHINRAGIGFDRILGILDGLANDAGCSFPPYDIEKTGEDSFRLTLALAGYGESDISLETEEDVLTVTGSRKEDGEKREYLYRGIASRSFERKFRLADHVEVKAATISNGLLAIDLAREVPEAKKPRKVEIVTQSANEAAAAA